MFSIWGCEGMWGWFWVLFTSQWLLQNLKLVLLGQMPPDDDVGSVSSQSGDEPTSLSLKMEDDCRPLLGAEQLGESSSNRDSTDSLDVRGKRYA